MTWVTFQIKAGQVDAYLLTTPTRPPDAKSRPVPIALFTLTHDWPLNQSIL